MFIAYEVFLTQQAHSAFYIAVYLLYSAEPQCVYLGLGVYFSPAFIWINMVFI